jgi:hypothetical protein
MLLIIKLPYFIVFLDSRIPEAQMLHIRECLCAKFCLLELVDAEGMTHVTDRKLQVNDLFICPNI